MNLDYDFKTGRLYKDLILSTGDNVRVYGVTFNDILKDSECFKHPYIMSEYLNLKYVKKSIPIDYVYDELLSTTINYSNIGDFEVDVCDYDKVMSTVVDLSIPKFYKEFRKPINLKEESQNNKEIDQIKIAKGKHLEDIGVSFEVYKVISMYYKLLRSGIDCIDSTFRVIYNLTILNDEIDNSVSISNMHNEIAVEALFQSKGGEKVFKERINELK